MTLKWKKHWKKIGNRQIFFNNIVLNTFIMSKRELLLKKQREYLYKAVVQLCTTSSRNVTIFSALKNQCSLKPFILGKCYITNNL